MMTPKQLSDLDVAFPASVTHLMPPYESIPDEFKRGNTKWNKLFADWFYVGVEKLQMTPKEGIERKDALRHIKAIMGSWEPKHEHKEAAVAYLLSQWFSEATWEQAKREGA